MFSIIFMEIVCVCAREKLLHNESMDVNVILSRDFRYRQQTKEGDQRQQLRQSNKTLQRAETKETKEPITQTQLKRKINYFGKTFQINLLGKSRKFVKFKLALVLFSMLTRRKHNNCLVFSSNIVLNSLVYSSAALLARSSLCVAHMLLPLSSRTRFPPTQCSSFFPFHRRRKCIIH